MKTNFYVALIAAAALTSTSTMAVNIGNELDETLLASSESVMLIKAANNQVENVTDAERVKVLAAVKTASNAWIKAFNTGNAAAAADQYEAEAVMTAKPFGTFVGRNDIRVFWENLISQGFAEVRYIEPEIKVVSANSAIVSSKWKMNNAHGVITKELWVLQDNGQAKLRVDNFEVLGE